MSNSTQRRTIFKLSLRSMRASRLRNIMGIFAIILTTALFSVICTIGISTINAYQFTTMKQSGGDGHLALRHIDDEIFNNIKNNPLIKGISYSRNLSDSIENPELKKRPGMLLYKDNLGLQYTFFKLSAGSWPKAVNEIAVDTTTLHLLNLNPELGTEINLNIKVNGATIEQKFILSGYWESDTSQKNSLFFTSTEYLNYYINEIENVPKKSVVATIKCNNSWGLQGKLERIITESGYVMDNPNSDKYIDGVVKWSNLTASMGNDLSAIISIVICLLLVAFTGYLLIYNIFQISVVNDIRYYSLLKCIGTTDSQIKSIITYQATLLTFMGMPFGMIAGYSIGKILVPMIINQSISSGIEYKVSSSPFIIIASFIFVALTVWFSVRKPSKYIANASLIETTKYTNNFPQKVENKKRERKVSKMYNIAGANVLRNKKQFFIVILSLSLCLVLLNSVVTITNGFDLNKYFSKFVDTDFYAARTEYFNLSFNGADTSVDESFIKMVSSSKEFQDGGAIYHEPSEVISVEFHKPVGNTSNEPISPDNNPYSQVFGIDPFVFTRLKVLEGNIDFEKLATGKYIILGERVEDDGKVKNKLPFEIGDKITLHNYRETGNSSKEHLTNEFTIMAKVEVSNTNHSRSFFTNYIFYLPKEAYLRLVTKESIMSYMFNAKDGKEEDMEMFLEAYIRDVEPNIDFESKNRFIKDYGEMKDFFYLIGVVFTIIVGLIGLLNLINSVVTSIMTRYHEFALLESIGMTRRQIRTVLCFEGLFYALGTVVISLCLSVLTSLFVIKNILNNLWFMNYHFTIYPMLICYPILLTVSILLPIVVVNNAIKESVSERLVKIV